jgi:hypothetical protein
VFITSLFIPILTGHFIFQEYEKLLDKYKSKEVRKQFLEVKKELQKLEPPENMKSQVRATAFYPDPSYYSFVEIKKRLCFNICHWHHMRIAL